MNNKTHLTTKISLFIVKYSRELRMEQTLEEKERQKDNGVCKKNEESLKEN